MTSEIETLREIGMLIARGQPATLRYAAQRIISLRRDASLPAAMHASLDGFIELWLFMYREAGGDWPIIRDPVLPEMVRLADPVRRPTPSGPSLTPWQRTIIKAPPSAEESRLFLDEISCEDGLREWCVWGKYALGLAPPRFPLMRIGGKDVDGRPITAMYRARAIERTWAPSDWEPDLALVEDTMLLASVENANETGPWLGLLLQRIQPYVRSSTEGRLRDLAEMTKQSLVFRGVVESRDEGLSATPAGVKVCRELLGPAWITGLSKFTNTRRPL